MATHFLADASRRGDGIPLDALPYADSELDEPGMRELVNSLILEEMSRYPGAWREQGPSCGQSGAVLHPRRFTSAAPDYSAEMPPLPAGPDGTFETVPASTAVRAELERIASGAPSTVSTDAARFDFPATPAGAAAEDPAAWDTAVARARVALEAQALAAINAELAAKYSVDAWKSHVAQLDSLQSVARARVQALQAQVTATNAARKAAQEGHSVRLRALTKRAADTAGNNFATAVACDDAAREVKRLRLIADHLGLGVAPEDGRG